MQIRSDRRYRFEVERAELWREIAEPERYTDWWPWLRSFDAHALTPGVRWRCVIQPPLPYTIRVDVHITEVVEGEAVSADVSGDLRGHARISLADGSLVDSSLVDGNGSVSPGSAANGHCEARVVSSLAPSSRVMGAAAWLVAPVARWGHDWVLSTGARQLGEALDGHH
jgi:hypothetical protein